MKIYLMGRGCGKTTQLIKRSAATGCTIVTSNYGDHSYIMIQAKQMGLTIPTPISYNAFLNSSNYIVGKDIKGFLIDNVDMLLKSISCNIPIDAITISCDGENTL